MDWQEIIINRLKLHEPTTRIILDKTGILLSSEFAEYLDKKEIAYSNAQSVPSILSEINSQKTVITQFIELPDYLKSKTEIVIFDQRALPLDIEASLMEKLSIKSLTRLLEYQVNSKKSQLISENNYKSFLKKAEKFSLGKELQLAESQINQAVRSLLNYENLLELGKLWGKYVYLCFRLNVTPDSELTNKVDEIVEPFVLQGKTKGAFYASVRNFKTVDKILPNIKGRNPGKFALICFDGMGCGEWHVLQDYLKDDFKFKEKYIFAIIPTLTCISRSAIFYADSEKVFNLKSLNEDKAFANYFDRLNVAAFREGELTGKDKLLGIDAVKVIYTAFDSLGHKTVFPTAEKRKHNYYKNVIHYFKSSTIKEELLLLKNCGYKLFFCSDHGNVLVTGNGKIIDQYLIETTSKRATIIKNTELAQFYDVNTFEIPFVNGKTVLMAKGRTAFSYKGKKNITHGGITVDELTVPFVEEIS